MYKLWYIKSENVMESVYLCEDEYKVKEVSECVTDDMGDK
jgi:hypothetical protein